MIDGRREGPFTLQQLCDAGIRPDTYVWCKGMEDWTRADEVADICRFFRLRIFDINHPAPPPSEEPVKEMKEEAPVDMWNNVDISRTPVNLVGVSIALIILCSPLTGCIALYFALRARKNWKNGNARAAHDLTRQAKMWCGISFFLGFIGYAFLSNFFR